MQTPVAELPDPDGIDRRTPTPASAPSGETGTECDPNRYGPRASACRRQWLISQILTVRSSDPDASQRPSGETVTELIQSAMALERLRAAASGDLPDPDGMIVGPRRQPAAIGRDCHRVDRIAMALERLCADASGDISQILMVLSRGPRC